MNETTERRSMRDPDKHGKRGEAPSVDGRDFSRSALVVMSGVLLSRVLGLVRDIVFAQVWGTGVAIAAFFIAFTAPNLLRALFAEGAFSAGFVPVFTHKLEKEGLAAAWQAATRILSLLAVVVCGIALLISGLAMLGSRLPGNELQVLALTLTSLLMLYAPLVCLSGALGCALNARGAFALPAYSSVLLNAVLIVTALTLCPRWDAGGEEGIFCLALAVLLAGGLQLFTHAVVARRRGMAFRFRWDPGAPPVRRVAMLMAPVLLGAGAMQINVAVDRLLAGWLGAMATGALYYSQRLAYLPVGLFGVALTVVALPAMSRSVARENVKELVATLGFSLRLVLFLGLPSALMLAVVGETLIGLLFQHGAFDAESSSETFWTLAFYLPGIPAFVAAKVAAAPFHARHDTRTPVKIAVVCLVLNVLLNLVLMQVLRQGGLALATTICSYLNTILLLAVLQRRLGPQYHFVHELRVGRILISAALLAVTAAAAARFLPAELGAGAWYEKTVAILVPVAAGGVVYLFAAWWLGVEELPVLLSGLRRGRARRHRG